MNVLTIIPARAGSERAPGKNWRLLGGRPLVRYAMDAVARSSYGQDVIVTSDTDEVLRHVADYPTFTALRRPAEISHATSLAIEYVRHALGFARARGGKQYDAVAIIQVTSPFTLPEDIDATVALLADASADSAASVMQIPHDLNPLKLKTMAAGAFLEPYFEAEAGRMAAHEVPRVYVRNGSVYVSRLATIQTGLIIGKACRGHLMPRERSVDINDEIDWKLAELMLPDERATTRGQPNGR